MTNAQRLKLLYDSGKSVFTLKTMQSLWGSHRYDTKIIAKIMADKNLICRIERGYYSLKEDFSPYELANLIVKPSYVSLHSALFYHGVSFQYNKEISSMSRLNYKRKMGQLIFVYYSMKSSLLYNLDGIDSRLNVAIAKAERALLDCCYLNIKASIDNPDKLNVTYLQKLSNLYPHTVQLKIKKLLERYDQKRI